MKRAEHDFIKVLASLVKKLPNSQVKDEIISLVDGYYLTVSEQTRKTDEGEHYAR